MSREGGGDPSGASHPQFGSGDSRLHRASARVKVVTLIAFAVLVVATPREWFGAFGLYAALVVGALGAARIRALTVLPRLVVELPFLVFALLVPVIATGPRVQVGGLALSVAGLWAAWGLLAKATLTVLAAIVLVTTTPPRRIVLALQQLGLPRPLSSIMAFMLRYLDLIVGEWQRMRIARTSRGFQPSGPRDWAVLAHATSALFVRSHARAERIHLAMLARGYDEGAA
ncbi:MAG: cobalt ECF transporter T component CbiQ [Candidatus Nanopelagicales bacterium]